MAVAPRRAAFKGEALVAVLALLSLSLSLAPDDEDRAADTVVRFELLSTGRAAAREVGGKGSASDRNRS